MRIYQRAKKLLKKIVMVVLRSNLPFKDFTIISNNCWAGLAVYKPYMLRYNTPTVNLGFNDVDYLRFLENFDHYINSSLQFIEPEQSAYPTDLLLRERYPVAKLGGDVEIHFQH